MYRNLEQFDKALAMVDEAVKATKNIKDFPPEQVSLSLSLSLSLSFSLTHTLTHTTYIPLSLSVFFCLCLFFFPDPSHLSFIYPQ